MASSDELKEKEKAVRASLQQFPTTTFYLQLADGAWISEPLKITKARGDAWRYLQASIPIRDRHIVAHIAIMDVFSFFHYMVTTYERTDQTYQRSMTTKFHAMKLDNNERGDHFIQRVLDSQQHLEYLGVTVNQDQARTLILDGLAWNPSATGEKRRESVYKTVIDKLDTQSKLLNRQMLLHEYRQAIIQRDVELDDVMGSDRWGQNRPEQAFSSETEQKPRTQTGGDTSRKQKGIGPGSSNKKRQDLPCIDFNLGKCTRKECKYKHAKIRLCRDQHSDKGCTRDQCRFHHVSKNVSDKLTQATTHMTVVVDEGKLLENEDGNEEQGDEDDEGDYFEVYPPPPLPPVPPPPLDPDDDGHLGLPVPGSPRGSVITAICHSLAAATNNIVSLGSHAAWLLTHVHVSNGGRSDKPIWNTNYRFLNTEHIRGLSQHQTEQFDEILMAPLPPPPAPPAPPTPPVLPTPPTSPTLDETVRNEESKSDRRSLDRENIPARFQHRTEQFGGEKMTAPLPPPPAPPDPPALPPVHPASNEHIRRVIFVDPSEDLVDSSEDPNPSSDETDSNDARPNREVVVALQPHNILITLVRPPMMYYRLSDPDSASLDGQTSEDMPDIREYSDDSSSSSDESDSDDGTYWPAVQLPLPTQYDCHLDGFEEEKRLNYLSHSDFTDDDESYDSDEGNELPNLVVSDGSESDTWSAEERDENDECETPIKLAVPSPPPPPPPPPAPPPPVTVDVLTRRPVYTEPSTSLGLRPTKVVTGTATMRDCDPDSLEEEKRTRYVPPSEFSDDEDPYYSDEGEEMPNLVESDSDLDERNERHDIVISDSESSDEEEINENDGCEIPIEPIVSPPPPPPPPPPAPPPPVGEGVLDWYAADTASSIHLTPRPTNVVPGTSCPAVVTVLTTDKRAKVRSDEKHDELLPDLLGVGSQITLKNVLTIRSALRGLVSIPLLADLSYKCSFGDTWAGVYRNGKLLIICPKVGSLYLVPTTRYQVSWVRSHVNVALHSVHDSGVYKGTLSMVTLTHRRFGHFEMDLLKKGGFPTAWLKGSSCFCKACAETKMTAASKPQMSTRKLTRPGELLSHDVQYALHISRRGAHLYDFIIDHYSRFITIIPITTRSEVWKVMIRFKRQSENMLGRAFGTIRGDQSPENMAAPLREECERTGTRLEFSLVYRQFQNGFCEANHRIHKVVSNTIDAQAGRAPVQFWDYREVYSADILNVARGVQHGDTSECPSHWWNPSFNSENERERFKTWGSEAYFLEPKEKRTIGVSSGRRGIFLGLCRESKGYLLLDIMARRVISARDVRFNESSFPFASAQPNPLLDLRNDDVPLPYSPLTSPHPVLPTSNTALPAMSRPSIREGDRDRPCDQAGEPTETKRQSQRSLEPSGKALDNIASFHTPEERESIADDPPPLPPPRTVKQALQSAFAVEWKKAMDTEMDQHKKLESYVLVTPPVGARVAMSLWKLDHKYDHNGILVRRKARWVVMGNTRKLGVDHTAEEVFADVMRLKTLRTLLAIIVQDTKATVKHFDISTAFLAADITKTVYVRQPEGYHDGTRKVCLLKKAVYGLPESMRLFVDMLQGSLLKFGLSRSKSDASLFYRNEAGKYLYVPCQVDDLYPMSNCPSMISDLLDHLAREFDIKDLGPLKHSVGVHFDIDCENGIIKMNQKAYKEKILERFQMTDCRTLSVPLQPGTSINKPTTSAEECQSVQYDLRGLVGCFNYLVSATAPEYGFVTSRLASHVNHFDQAIATTAKQPLRYMAGHLDDALVLKRQEVIPASIVTAFADASFADNTDDFRSQSAAAVFIYGNLVFWLSKKQKSVATSTHHAETMALHAAIREVVHQRRLIAELGHQEQNPSVVWTDNKAVASSSNNFTHHSTNKHIQVKYFYKNELVTDGVIRVRLSPTGRMLADAMTKPLSRQVFRPLKQALHGLFSMPEKDGYTKEEGESKFPEQYGNNDPLEK
jgi:hypothetical protein